jgi:SPP1 gp7 family putative phage head morphogenesis protein
MESSFTAGAKSVSDWIKHHHSDYAASDIVTTLKEGNPSAAAFMKFQAFTTAAVQDQRIRTRIQAALAGNLKRGENQVDFKKVIDSEFDKAGLTRLNPYQVQNIYYTNTSLAFSAGQMQKMIEVSDDFPYWKYSATMDSKTRPDHARLHGKIFRMGDFQFYPPIGFRCRCTAIPLTARQAARFLSSTAPLEGGQRHSMPTTEERENLTNTLSNAEFVGNKNEKYMKWLAKEYDKADKETQAHIDKAIADLKREIGENQKEGLKQFFGNEFIEKTWEEFVNSEIAKKTQAYKLSTKQAYYIYAYTLESPIYKELNGWLFREIPPAGFSKSQLLTMKRELTNSLKKLPKYEGIVWRYIKNIDSNTLKQYKKDAVISWDGFSSSTKIQKLSGFDDRNFIFKIHSKSSRGIEQFSDHNENETLFIPGKFKVIDVDKKGNKYYFELMEED